MNLKEQVLFEFDALQTLRDVSRVTSLEQLSVAEFSGE